MDLCHLTIEFQPATLPRDKVCGFHTFHYGMGYTLDSAASVTFNLKERQDIANKFLTIINNNYKKRKKKQLFLVSIVLKVYPISAHCDISTCATRAK